MVGRRVAQAGDLLKRLLAAVGVVAVLLVPTTARAEPAASIEVTGDLTYGSSITVTATYPSAARRKIGRQQMVQPQINVGLYQTVDGVTSLVFFVVSWPADEENLGGGWWRGTTPPIPLGGPSRADVSWDDGAAFGSAWCGYFTDKTLDWHTVASVELQVT